MPDTLDITITIVSWNTRSLLKACLHSIFNAPTRAKVEVHVIDNDSEDGSVEMVKSAFPSAKLIINQANLGFAKANNQSWLQSQGRYWLLLNSDAEIQNNAIDDLVAFMDANPQVGLATARLNNLDGSPQNCAQPLPRLWLHLFEFSRLHKIVPSQLRGRTLLGSYWSYDETIPVGWTWGTALIARREAVESVGPLSEEFFMYGEDLEWCLRMRKAGWQIWYCHTAEVLHHGGQSTALKWEDTKKQEIILDNCYKAISMHYGQMYVRILQMVSLITLKIDQALKQLSGRKSEHQDLINYYLNSMKRHSS